MLGAPISAIGVTARLNTIQTALYACEGWGLHAMAMDMRLRPDGFSREMRAEHSAHLRRRVAERWILQQMLPTEAANDTEPLPGAA